MAAGTCDDAGRNNTADCTQHNDNQSNCEDQDDGIDAKWVYDVSGSKGDDAGGNNTAACTEHNDNQSNCEAQDDGLGGSAKCVYTTIDQRQRIHPETGSDPADLK